MALIIRALAPNTVGILTNRNSGRHDNERGQLALRDLGLQVQPFRTHGAPILVVQYDSHNLARRFLADFFACDAPIALFSGPPLSGKTTILKESIAARPPGLAVSVVDGAGCRADELLQNAIAGYGYREKLATQGEMLAMLRVFCRQQTAAGLVPLLVIDNAHELERDALEVLLRLEDFRVQQSSALQIVLMSGSGSASLLSQGAFSVLGRDSVLRFDLGPMSCSETIWYLHRKLQAAGCASPRDILSIERCEGIYAASGGWPGIAERMAILKLAADMAHGPGRPAIVPVKDSIEADSEGSCPRLLLTLNGEDVDTIDFTGARFMIGRSTHNDLIIDSRFISRYHVLLTRQNNEVLLMDLNSRNGTYVNSRPVMQTIVRPNDIISVGNYRVKFIADAATFAEPSSTTQQLAETIVMRSLEDLQNSDDKDATGILSIIQDKTGA